MEKCKEIIERKMKEWPFYRQMFSSITGNSFVQTLIFIMIGIIILFFAKGENKEIINTVGVTIITASLFKFLLSANAFTKVISNVIKESFLDMTFIKDYKDAKLFTILDNVSSEILDRNYKDIKEPLKKEIYSILGEQNGYYKSLKLEYTDISEGELTKTSNITTLVNVSRYEEKYRAKMIYEIVPSITIDEHFKLISIKLNNNEIKNVDVKKEETTQNGTKLVSFIYEFPLEVGETKIEIKTEGVDKSTEHGFFMKKTCANVKVIYKFDDTIIEPTIISKYGETELKNSRYSNTNLEEDYGTKPFFKSEFLFIKYKRNVKC